MATYESYKVGDHEFSVPSFGMKVLKYDYGFADLDLTIPIDAGVIVLGVGHEVVTAFDGGTEAINIGDGSTTDLWMASAVVAPTSAGSFSHSFPLKDGIKTGASAEKVVLTASTELTAGAGSVYLFIVDTRENWRTSGQF